MHIKKLNDIKALIADDEEDARTAIRLMLNEIGIGRIYEVEDGETALELFEMRREEIDFIISDWNMPQKTGFDFLKHINSNNINIPFIMVTARADQGSVLNAQKTGATAYLLKPFTLEELRRKVFFVLQ